MYYSLTLIKSTYYNLSQSQRALGRGLKENGFIFSTIQNCLLLRSKMTSELVKSFSGLLYNLRGSSLIDFVHVNRIEIFEV